MVLIAPKIDTFGEEFARALGQGAGQGIGSTPDLMRELIKEKRSLKGQYAETGQKYHSMIDERATPIELAAAGKRAAKLAKLGKSPEEMQYDLAQDATKQANLLSRIEEESISENPWNYLKSLYTGKKPGGGQSLDNALQPLLEQEEGKRTARRKLSEKGFFPEEIEKKVNPLNKSNYQTLKSMNKFKFGIGQRSKDLGRGVDHPMLDEKQRNQFQANFRNILAEDPNANLLLLREEYQKKGVNWKEFSEAVNKFEKNGEVDFSKNPDYEYMATEVRKPPLKRLKKILFG